MKYLAIAILAINTILIYSCPFDGCGSGDVCYCIGYGADSTITRTNESQLTKIKSITLANINQIPDDVFSGLEIENMKIFTADISTIGENYFRGVLRLDNLGLENIKFSKNSLTHLENLTKTVLLTETSFSDEILNLKELTKLSIIRSPDETIVLSDMSNLKEITISGGNLTNVSISMMPVLDKLEVKDTFSLVSISLSGVPNITQLDLSNNRISQLDEAFFGQIPKLSNFIFAGNKLTSISIENLSELTQLNLANNNFETVSISNLSVLSSINLDFNKIKSLNFSGIPNVSLSLKNNSLENGFLINDMKVLGSLDLTDNLIEDMDFLKEASNLKTIILKNNRIKQFNQTVLDLMVGLIKLDLTANLLGDFVMEKNVSKFGIEDLYLDFNIISTIRLSSFNSLGSLSFKNNPLTSFSVSSSTIEELHFENIAFGNLKLSSVTVSSISMVNTTIAQSEITQLNGVSSLSISNSDINWLPKNLPSTSKITITLTKINITDYSFGDLTELKLTSNGIESLPEGFFDNYSKVKVLDLSNNILKNFTLSTSMDYLETLTLSGNSITSFEKGLFDKIPNIIEIDLSSNSIRSDIVISGLKAIKSINMRNNLIKIVKIDGLENAGEVLFSNNLIEIVEISNSIASVINFDKNKLSDLTDSFVDVKAKKLSLADNNVQVKSFVFQDSLAESIEHLNLDSNDIDEFSTHFFKSFSNLKRLSLSKNSLKNISLPQSLLELDLSYNYFSQIPSLESVPGLESLKMSFNLIVSLPYNIPGSSIHTIDLSGNFIGSIKKTTFQKNSNLKELLLSNNSISDLESEFIYENSFIEKIDLSNQNNNLKAINKFAFAQSQKLSDLISIDLSNNDIEVFSNQMLCSDLGSLPKLRIKIDSNLTIDNCVYVNLEVYNNYAGASDLNLRTIQGSNCADTPQFKFFNEVGNELYCPDLFTPTQATEIATTIVTFMKTEPETTAQISDITTTTLTTERRATTTTFKSSKPQRTTKKNLLGRKQIRSSLHRIQFLLRNIIKRVY